MLSERAKYSGVHRILEAASTIESHRTFHVRNGDVDPASQPVDERNNTHHGATILANVLGALMFATTGPDSDERRFARVNGEEGNKVPYYYGYHANQWLAMIQGGVNLIHFRRRPSSHYIVDGKPHGKVSGIPILSVDHMTGVVSGDMAEKLPQSTLQKIQDDFRGALSQFKPPDADEVTTDKKDGILQKIDKRMNARLEFLCSTPRKSKAFRAKNIKKNKSSSQKIDKEEFRLPPISEDMLDNTLQAVSACHGAPKTYHKDGQSAEILNDLICESDGTMGSFMASQEAMAERLAEAQQESMGLSHDEAKARIRQVIKQGWTSSKMTSNMRPPEVNFKEVLAKFDLATDKPQREHLKLNPGGNPDFTVMHHQLVDAFLLWTMENSVLRGALMANEVGIGKTITAICVIILDWLDMKRRAAEGEPIEAYPTLMVVPAGLVGQTFNEVTKWFGGLIDVKCYYGSAAEFTGDRQKRTLSKSQWWQEMVETMDRAVVTTKPENGLKLYLTSYSTAKIRFFKRFISHNMAEVDHVEAREAGDTDELDLEAEANAEVQELIDDAKAVQAAQQAANKQGEPDEGEADEDGEVEMDEDNTATVSTHTCYRLTFSSVPTAKFKRIIMDEAHALRNPKSGYSRMMRVFPRMSTLLVTATPTLNRMSDLQGLLNQIHAFSDLNMSTEVFNPEVLEDGYDFDNISHACDQNGGEKHTSLFSPEATQEQMKKVKEFAVKTGKKPWAILPQFSSQISGDADSSNSTSDAIYKAGLDSVQLRRTMQDPVKVVVPIIDKDGNEVGEKEEQMFPGLNEKDEDKHLIHHYTNMLASELNNVAPPGDESLPDTGEAGSGSDADAKPRINMAIHRMLLMSAFDARTTEVFCREDNVSNFLDSAHLRARKQENGAKTYQGRKPTKAGARKGKSKAAQQAPPSVCGVEQVELLRSRDPDGGMMYTYNLVDYDKTGMPFPLDRPSAVHWATSRSPILAEIAKMVAANMKKKKRTLVMVDNQYCQQQVVAMLEMIGYEVGSIRASDSNRDREDVVEQFNSPDSGMAAFVLNASTNMSGLNLHHCCSKGIIAQFTWNVASLIQIMGRIDRVGQEDSVTWTILRVNGSYYDIQENKMCQKFAEVLRNEGHMPKYLASANLQRIVAYEQIRVMLSQPFNRYSWCAPGIDPPGTIQEYNDMRHRRLGQFYTAIARLLMVLPEELQNSTDDLALCMSSLAQEFEKLDESHDCYQEPSAEWIKEMLDKHAEAHKDVPATSRPRQLSQRYVMDSDDEDGEGGVEAHLQRKEAHRRKREAEKENFFAPALEIAMDLEKLKKGKEYAAAIPNYDRILGPLYHARS
ncbi:hypothetical protein PG991_001211 [Apiospora marii]|uniref:Helicase ATP-binding domain-containing protein n=1 Tax=Apiospora marii TaxID=335849 RepID=A0ABR1SW03_9PEZI